MTKKFRFLAILVLVSVAVLVLSAGSAAAQAIRTDFSTHLELGVSSPEKAWVSDGITHTRGVYYENLNQVSIAGVAVAITGIGNFNYDAGGNGTDHGTVLIEALNGSGGWSGHFEGVVQAGLISNRFVGKGFGSFAGTQIKGNYVESQPFVATFSGEILDTQGD